MATITYGGLTAAADAQLRALLADIRAHEAAFQALSTSASTRDRVALAGVCDWLAHAIDDVRDTLSGDRS